VKEVVISRSLLDEIHRFARSAYPEECCGFLLAERPGVGRNGTRTVVAIAPAENRSDGERARRFVIPPGELESEERRAESEGRLVIGFYHSHPDHPARPSQFDQEHAWPWYVYLIASSDAGGAVGPVGAFELDPDRREFHPLTITESPGLPRETSEGTSMAAPTERRPD